MGVIAGHDLWIERFQLRPCLLLTRFGATDLFHQTQQQAGGLIV